MRCESKTLKLYGVTDRELLQGALLAEQVEKALQGGVTMLQLREKDLPEEEFVSEAQEMKALCDKYGVPLIINDSVAVAQAAEAAGVHLGQGDTEIAAARAVLGPDAIIGASVHTVEEAVQAEQQGADYLGAGAVFGTATKEDAIRITRGTLAEICKAVSIPVVAIGGVTEVNAQELAGTGAAGIAATRAIFARNDTVAAARALRCVADCILVD